MRCVLHLDGLKSLLAYRRRPRPGRERDAAFYDRHVRRHGDEFAPSSYARSSYYFLWAIIVDRLRREGFGRVLENIEADLHVVSRFAAGKRCLCSVPNFDFESHARYFRDASEAAARYGRFFHTLDIMTIESSTYRGDQFFLFEGARNDYVEESGTP